MEWARQKYNEQYHIWVPWLEDLYLRYFTQDNKASYATRQNLSKTKTATAGLAPLQLGALQDDAHGLAAGQLGRGGLLQPLGDGLSHEVVNRAERRGRDDRGQYVPYSVDASGLLGR
ncbi:hypothetical protein GGS23DRAFT_600374 [Durotheca rogersii]|uniref:uncharacterized protein n=1 Tax=Durotheca rogersii TaxID=419775 RepID=UPI00221EBBE2|nr:uncharacterized protein GGS23DRAFT_600374 [Durotheca rogersii]KAI5859448.1 hypothetical protein GGS23DRAFT_600374 [Durotheca rogersii]